MQVLAMINTGRSKNKLCMSWLRELFWVCFIHNIDLFATYIKSEDNVLADHLSRLPYKGYVAKCIQSLQDYNMCCFISSQCSERLAGCPDPGAHRSPRLRLPQAASLPPAGNSHGLRLGLSLSLGQVLSAPAQTEPL